MMKLALRSRGVPEDKTNSWTDHASGLVHRQCARGESGGMSETCAEYQQKKFLGKLLQAKHRINDPGDAYEQEADRVAEQVMGMSGTEVNKQHYDTGSPRVQRHTTSGGAGELQAPPIVHDVLSSPAQPLDAATRAFFELRFSHDLSHVRVHAGEEPNPEGQKRCDCGPFFRAQPKDEQRNTLYARVM